MKCNIMMPYFFRNGMVLQRDHQIKIWGNASPAEKLELTFCKERYTTDVNEDGTWEIILHGRPAGGPYEIQISCKDCCKAIDDILVGDVWVLGGQSNMEIPVSRTLDLFENEVKSADCPEIRQFYVPHRCVFSNPCDDLAGGSWIPVTPETVYDFSAIGYFFAKELYEKYKIPIGLVHTAVGGTPIQAWLSENTLQNYPDIYELLAQCKDEAYVKEIKKREMQEMASWYQKLNEKDKGLAVDSEPWYCETLDDHDWKGMVLPGNFMGTELEKIYGSVWFRKELIIPGDASVKEAKLFLGTIIDGDETYLNGKLIGSTEYQYPPRRYEIPEGLLKPGKNLLAVRVILTLNVGAFVIDKPYYLKTFAGNLPIDGNWKYRIGVSMKRQNPLTFFEYKPAGDFNGMIVPLRKFDIRGVLWYQGEANTDDPYHYHELFADLVKDWRNNWNCGTFPFLYVQLANYCPWHKESEVSKWAVLREEQRKCMDIPGTGMAVTYDTGEYNDLHPQDKKSVAHRLALWAMKWVYHEEVVYSGPLYHHMAVEGNKIRLYFTNIGSGIACRDDRLRTFMICGKNGCFMDAQAKLDGDTVIVFCRDIENPTQVRYAWCDNPEEANLYNIEGLPASPFTTEG
jgi:sialate O-acetylesterase